MGNSCIYQFFNNATIATVIAVVIGSLVAVCQYKKQKEVDRKNNQKREIIDNLILINEKIKYVLLILDRITNTYNKYVKNKGNNEINNFLDALKKYEIPKLSQAINEDIPLLDMKIANLIFLYFEKEREIIKAHKNYKNELKNWHDFVLNEVPGPKFSFKEKTAEINELSIDKLGKNIKDLIKQLINNS